MIQHTAMPGISEVFARECFSQVDIPTGTALYVAGGIPTSFNCYRRQEWNGDLYDWLHLPGEIHAELAGAFASVPKDSPEFLSNAVDAEWGEVYAFGSNGKIIALLLSDGTTDSPTSKINSATLRGAVTVYIDGIHATQFNMAAQFVRRLFRRDQSLTDFFEGYLSLLCDQWPHCLAGIYYRTQDTYRLRFVSGSLKYTDKMNGRIDPASAEEWKEIIAEGRYYRPIDLLPNEPTLLPTPPSYLVLVEGPQSPRTEFVTAVIVSGDIDQAAAENIIEVAELASELDETQFATVSEINTLFGNMSSSLSSGVDMRAALKAIYGILARQLDVRSMLLSDGGEQVWRVTGRGDERPLIEMLASQDAPEPSFSPDASQRLRIVQSDTGPTVSRDNPDQRILTRADIPIRNIDGSVGMLEIGSSLSREALESGRETLRASAEFLQLCLALSRLFADGQVIVSDSALLNAVATRRTLKVMQQIADGHFHEILGELSMVLGQSELIARDSAPGSVALSDDQFFAAAHKISKAVDRISYKVEMLREVASLAAGTSRQSISAREFVIKVPTIVEGFARHIRDTRNVQVGIEVDLSNRIDFGLPREAVSDSILPVVMEVMGQAGCPGQIQLSLTGTPDARRLSMTFPRQLIAPLTLEKVMEEALGNAQFTHRDDFTGDVRAGNLSVRYRQIASDILEIDYTVVKTPGDRTTDRSQSSNLNRKS